MNKPFITYKEENEQLRDKVRELEEENARLKSVKENTERDLHAMRDKLIRNIDAGENIKAQLTARVRELEEENARLKAECDDIKQVQFPRKLDAVAAGWKKQLAASQLHAEQLRGALQTFIDEHEECTDADDWMAMLCSIEAHHVAEEALALPRDTSALDAYVSEKVKEAMK